VQGATFVGVTLVFAQGGADFFRVTDYTGVGTAWSCNFGSFHSEFSPVSAMSVHARRIALSEPESHDVEIKREPVGLCEQVVAEVSYATFTSEPGYSLDGHLRRAQSQQTARDRQFQLR